MTKNSLEILRIKSNNNVVSQINENDNNSIVSSFNDQRFAGITPKKFKAQNSLEYLSNKSINDESQINENESNEAINVLKSLIDENIISLQKERVNNDSQETIFFQENNNNNNTNDVDNKICDDNIKENSCKTIDSYHHDSDIDMFEDFNSPEINYTITHESNNGIIPLNLSRPLYLANYSNEFVEDKSCFAPKENFIESTNTLKMELYDASIDEILYAVEEVIEFLEMSDE